jgi:GTP cyclohydrolase I
MTTVANTAIATPAIEDVQNRLDTRQIVIQKVGIKSIKHPIYFQNVDGHKQHTIATFDLAVNLAAHLKGTHMSRFVELIHELNGQFGVVELQNLLKKMLTKMQAEQGYIDVSFPYFRTKQAPVSQVSSSLDYQVTLHGEIHHGITAIQYTVVVPVTSLCPCSKEISAYGAHNQRSHITLKVASQQPLCLDKLIGMVESQGSCELYATLKRSDEKYITEKAYENPKFVEDIVRDVALELSKDLRILSFSVEAENFESIHNHSAYAKVVSE